MLCLHFSDKQQPGAPIPTSDEFIISQNASKPFCQCGFDDDQHPMPKSGNCTDLNRRSGLSCYKAQTLCRDTCTCNDNYVDPTECDPQTCNNATKPFCFCKCGIDNVDYLMPESGNCMDGIKHFSTTPIWYYLFGFPCYKARTMQLHDMARRPYNSPNYNSPNCNSPNYNSPKMKTHLKLT